VFLIAYLSLVPDGMEVRTAMLPGLEEVAANKSIRDGLEWLEHAVAYAGTVVVSALAYPTQPIKVIIAMMCGYASMLELLQAFSPGRDPGLDGALASSAGAVIGGWIRAKYGAYRHEGS
jgi:VanZ family protein